MPEMPLDTERVCGKAEIDDGADLRAYYITNLQWVKILPIAKVTSATACNLSMKKMTDQ